MRDHRSVDDQYEKLVLLFYRSAEGHSLFQFYIFANMGMASTFRLVIPALSIFTTALSLPLPGWDNHHEDGPLVRLLYEYPLSSGTWLENIAVRPSGEILVTKFNKPEIVQFDPFEAKPEPKTIHNFPGYLALTGIAEIAPDSFAVAAGNVSFTVPAQRGSWSVWNVGFPSPHADEPEIKKIADVPEAKFLNGMCNLPSSQISEDILIGDISQGVIRRVDTRTGDSSLVVQDKLTATAPDPLFERVGVNGIHTKDDILYFVNTAKSVFASVPIHPNGTSAGQPKVIQRVNKPEEVFYFDDFAIKHEDAYLVTGSGNSIERIGLDGTPKGRIIAGDLNSTQIAGPTSAAFGRTERDSHVLYVITSGGTVAPVDGNITVGAQLLAVDTRKWPY